MNTEEQIKCKPIKVITDARVIMDLPTTSYYGRRPYDKEKINSEGKDLISAINDHISLKDYKPYIDIVEEEMCSSCNKSWETMIDDQSGKTICANCGEEVE